ncbi:acetyltransferase [Peptostreptococcus russellii]|uniref:Acetyltransferase n=1 Tax=Peptostreptococcus russellii TaxID=215200 RepID=A0A2P7Q0L4_9FIRM|nr:N-acetyltransferase [Peptostreptococcus russellii]PSJ31477.1 acetyltransferase [Peptostreptococcus russellii]
MIKKFEIEDLDEIMNIWLETNISAHGFIKASYWKENFEMVEEMMMSSEIYLYKEDNKIYGFIGLIDDYIAGIFIKDKYQSRGIGKNLLDYVKSNRNRLLLSVYNKNNRAVEFYKREGFIIVKNEIDEANNEKEFVMEWQL